MEPIRSGHGTFRHAFLLRLAPHTNERLWNDLAKQAIRAESWRQEKVQSISQVMHPLGPRFARLTERILGSIRN